MTAYLLPEFRVWLELRGKSISTSRTYATAMSGVFRALGCSPEDWPSAVSHLRDPVAVLAHFDGLSENTRLLKMSAWSAYVAFLATRGVEIPALRSPVAPRAPEVVLAPFVDWLQDQKATLATIHQYRKQVLVCLHALGVMSLDLPNEALESAIDRPDALGDAFLRMSPTSARQTIPPWNAFLRFLRETRGLEAREVSLSSRPKFGVAAIGRRESPASYTQVPGVLVSALWELLRLKPDVEEATLRALRWDCGFSEPAGEHPSRAVWSFTSPLDPRAAYIQFSGLCQRALGALWDVTGGSGTVVPQEISLSQLRAIRADGKAGKVDLLPMETRGTTPPPSPPISP